MSYKNKEINLKENINVFDEAHGFGFVWMILMYIVSVFMNRFGGE